MKTRKCALKLQTLNYEDRVVKESDHLLIIKPSEFFFKDGGLYEYEYSTIKVEGVSTTTMNCKTDFAFASRFENTIYNCVVIDGVKYVVDGKKFKIWDKKIWAKEKEALFEFLICYFNTSHDIRLWIAKGGLKHYQEVINALEKMRCIETKKALEEANINYLNSECECAHCLGECGCWGHVFRDKIVNWDCGECDHEYNKSECTHLYSFEYENGKCIPEGKYTINNWDSSRYSRVYRELLHLDSKFRKEINLYFANMNKKEGE